MKFDHFAFNPFATWPGEVRVDDAGDFASAGGHGFHRGGDYNKASKPVLGIGEDFYFQVPLTIEQ